MERKFIFSSTDFITLMIVDGEETYIAYKYKYQFQSEGNDSEYLNFRQIIFYISHAYSLFGKNS